MTDEERARGWREHARQRLLAWQRLSHRQRLDWLWQAKQFAERARQAAQERRGAPRGSGGDR
jgi:hypothetical protein